MSLQKTIKLSKNKNKRRFKNRRQTKRFLVAKRRASQFDPCQMPHVWFNSLYRAASVIRHTHGGILQSINMKKKTGYWLSIVRVDFKGRRLVKFVDARTLPELITLTGAELSNPTKKWKDSNF